VNLLNPGASRECFGDKGRGHVNQTYARDPGGRMKIFLYLIPAALVGAMLYFAAG
jgi:hypothetical protein